MLMPMFPKCHLPSKCHRYISVLTVSKGKEKAACHCIAVEGLKFLCHKPNKVRGIITTQTCPSKPCWLKVGVEKWLMANLFKKPSESQVCGTRATSASFKSNAWKCFGVPRVKLKEEKLRGGGNKKKSETRCRLCGTVTHDCDTLLYCNVYSLTACFSS